MLHCRVSEHGHFKTRLWFGGAGVQNLKLAPGVEEWLSVELAPILNLEHPTPNDSTGLGRSLDVVHRVPHHATGAQEVSLICPMG